MNDHIDICAARHGGRDTSRYAHGAITPIKGGLRRQIERMIWATEDHGATCEDLEILTKWSHQTVSARLSELLAKGAIRRHEQRATRSGRVAWAYVHTRPEEFVK